MIHEFHLSPPEKGGVSCSADGAFVDAIPILKRLRKSGRNAWQPRDCEELSEELGGHYGLPINMSSKMGGLRAIANALTEGDLARAQIATVLLGIPDPPRLSKRDRSRDQMIKLIRDLDWSGMLKWDSGDHPRWPAPSSDGKGGEFAPKGEGGTSASPASQSEVVDRTSSYGAEPEPTRQPPRIQLADVGMSDAYDDPVAEAARAAAATHAATARDIIVCQMYTFLPLKRFSTARCSSRQEQRPKYSTTKLLRVGQKSQSSALLARLMAGQWVHME